MDEWLLSNIRICVELGHVDDSDIDLVVKASNIPLGQDQSGISVKEGSGAAEVMNWPGITLKNQNRRQEIYGTAKIALETAEKVDAKNIGFFTTGLEVARVPSWEVAEEIIKAVYDHSRNENNLDRVLLVASSPIQVSSFQYVLNNIATVIPDVKD